MIKELLIMSFLLCGIGVAGQAQKYRTAAGVRLESDRFGLTLQQKLHKQATLEGIIAIGAHEYSGTALYEWHRPMLGKRFNYYLGGGGHIGNLKDKGVFTGVDGILGIEYKINGLPFLLSADVKPAVHFNHDDWVTLSSGISVRYVLLKDKKPEIRWWQFRKQQQEKKRQKEKEQQKGGLRGIFKKQDA